MNHDLPAVAEDAPLALLIRLGAWADQVEAMEPGYSRSGAGFKAGMSNTELLDAVRGWWRLDVDRATREGYDHAVAVHQGVTRAVIKIDEWLPKRDDGRWAFIGSLVKNGPVYEAWVGPDGYRLDFKQGSSNPIMYSANLVGSAPSRQPTGSGWTEEERVLCLDLYFKIGLASRNHQDVVALSDELRSFAFHPDSALRQNYRNANGVSSKLANFAAIDRPTQERAGTDTALATRRPGISMRATQTDSLKELGRYGTVMHSARNQANQLTYLLGSLGRSRQAA